MLTWSDNYIMGIDQFDQEHQQLFRLAEQVIQRMRERSDEANMRMFVIREAVTYINSYFDRHAQAEEAYMRRIGYDGYGMHKKLHDDFHSIQMVKYQKIIENGQCNKDDVWDFIGSGIGWLLEHIATADMAIVGKGILVQTDAINVNEAALEQEINVLLTSTLNIEANAKIANTNYAGEYFGKAIHQKIVYQTDAGETSIISGIEQSFMLDVAKRLYGSEVKDEVSLILSTFQLFSVHFWQTLGMRFMGSRNGVAVKESHFIMDNQLAVELEKLNPTTSVLFNSDKGKFYVACDSAYPLNQ